MNLSARCVLTLLIGSFSSTTLAAPAPAEAFASRPQMLNAQMSPNGQRIAYEDNSGEPKVVTFDLEARKVLRVFNLERESKVTALHWADDETLLIDIGFIETLRESTNQRYEMERTIAADISGGRTRQLLMNDGARALVTGADLIALRTSTPKTVVMSTLDYSAAKHRGELGTRLTQDRKDSGWVGRLFEVDLRTGKGKILDEGTPFTYDWVVDDKRTVARSEWDPNRSLFLILAKDSGGWREIHRQEDGGRLDLFGLTADRKAIVARGSIDQGYIKAWSIPLDGSERKVLLEDPAADIGPIYMDEYSRAPLGAWIAGTVDQARWLDPKAEAQIRGLSKSFPGRHVEIHSRSENGQRLLVLVTGAAVVPTFYVVDLSRRSADVLGEMYPQLANVPLGEMRMITYKARDGAEIPAYLTVPPGVEAKNLPLVVLPHDGPVDRDYLAFDWLVQFLATRGYAVLQPQYRGSIGFGEAFRQAGHREWGGLIQADITDGVKSMIDQGIADARRVAIAGRGFGGHAALAGAAFTPELYACAASLNGIADLPYMLVHSERVSSGEESNRHRFWLDHLGAATDATAAARSPARAVERIKAPILLLHATEDARIPISQSEVMAKALKDAGKTHKFVRLEGGDTDLSQTATRVQVLKELETFFAAYLFNYPSR
jgi:dipeptidyl aminopeptidase/acylaminoacyl peptidase